MIYVSNAQNLFITSLIPSLPEIVNFSTKYFILSKVYTDEGGIR